MDRFSFDRAYLERLRDGHPETERHFYAYFDELVVIKVRARGGVQVDDIRQETFLRVLRTLRSPDHGLRDPGALGAFVNSVCNNVLREHGRSVRRYDALPVESESFPDRSSASAESRLITEERQQTVRRVIDELPPRDREVLRAVIVEERDKKEVCRKLAVTPEYLRVLLHRAKNQFKALYTEREATPQIAQDAGAAPSVRKAVV